MKDATNYILTEMYQTISGNVSIGGNVVPYYSLHQDPSANDSLFMNVASSFIVPDPSSKSNFHRMYTVTLDIVNIQQVDLYTEYYINEVANQVMQLLKPSPSQVNVVSNTDFICYNITLDNVVTFNDTVNQVPRLRKTLNINFHIKQK